MSVPAFEDGNIVCHHWIHHAIHFCILPGYEANPSRTRGWREVNQFVVREVGGGWKKWTKIREAGGRRQENAIREAKLAQKSVRETGGTTHVSPPEHESERISSKRNKIHFKILY